MFGKIAATTGFLVILAGALAAPTAAVEVIRGGPAEATEVGEAGAVQIMRGSMPDEIDKEEQYHSRRHENLWIVDEEAGTITGCNLRNTFFIPIGEARSIPDLRCRTEPWPQDDLYFQSVFHRF
jgi:hypothetical protein